MGHEAYADFLAATRDKETIHGMLEDYRAGFGIDRQHDEEDRHAARMCNAPRSCSGRCVLISGSPIVTYWAFGAHGQRGLDCGHHMAEEAPQALAAELRRFLISARSTDCPPLAAVAASVVEDGQP
jgi:haloacetate dehalogenase